MDNDQLVAELDEMRAEFMDMYKNGDTARARAVAFLWFKYTAGHKDCKGEEYEAELAEQTAKFQKMYFDTPAS